jgi:hypothetical protein
MIGSQPAFAATAAAGTGCRAVAFRIKYKPIFMLFSIVLLSFEAHVNTTAILLFLKKGILMFRKSMSPNRSAHVQGDVDKTPPAAPAPASPTEAPVTGPSSPIPAVETPAKS